MCYFQPHCEEDIDVYLCKCIHQLEALRERRPPWLNQIITPILPTVKILSRGGERLTPPQKKKKKRKKKKKKKKKGSLPAPRSDYATTITVFFLLIYSS